jgi:hypothetical protein
MQWACLAASVAIVAAYELVAAWKRRRQPMRFARTAHAAMRANWARAVRARPGNEVLVVQTLRNSVMAASISASTAVLAFVALVAQLAPRPPDRGASLEGVFDFHTALLTLLMALVFAAFMLSAMAVRFFNHAGYMLATPPSPSDGDLTEIGARYVARAGHLYSMSLRSLLVAAPFVVGFASPAIMVLAAIALVAVLVWYDRPPPRAGDR